MQRPRLRSLRLSLGCLWDGLWRGPGSVLVRCHLLDDRRSHCGGTENIVGLAHPFYGMLRLHCMRGTSPKSTTNCSLARKPIVRRSPGGRSDPGCLQPRAVPTAAGARASGRREWSRRVAGVGSKIEKAPLTFSAVEFSFRSAGHRAFLFTLMQIPER